MPPGAQNWADGVWGQFVGDGWWSQVNEFILGQDDFAMLVVPPSVYHGYQTISEGPALILNFPDQVYDPSSPDEGRIPSDSPDVPYLWEMRPS